MPKTKQSESVLHDWVHQLSFQQQALLLTGMRGPDGCPKHNTAKFIVRYLRGAVIKPAGDWNGDNDNDFMWGEYIKVYEVWQQHERLPDRRDNIFIYHAGNFFDDHDEYPHHFLMHLIHCAQVVTYHHPDAGIAAQWLQFYHQACKSFHMTPETVEQMDARLNDFGCGI